MIRRTLLFALCAWAGACSDVPRGEPIDLVPRARLRAGHTRPVEGLAWPREVEDAIATVRDGNPYTGYKPPVDTETWIEIDLQPWLGRAVPLETIRADWPEGLPARVQVQLFEGCGGAPTAEWTWDRPAEPLDLSQKKAGCVRIILLAQEPVVLGGLELIGRVMPEDAEEPVPAAAVIRHPSYGVIEGFYGIPWSLHERRNMLRHMAALGLGAYLYAPKNDPLHRDDWRIPYPEQDVTAFAELSLLASDLGVTLLFGISPFIDFDPEDPADYDALTAKLTPLIEAGVGGVALLADDIEFATDGEIDGPLGQAHVRVANRLLLDLRGIDPDMVFWFVPTVYTDGRLSGWSGGPDYLAAMAELDQDIGLMWVGPGVFNDTLAPADLEAFTSITGRSPVLWDNFWANDGGDEFLGRLLLAPYTGHSADLPGAVAGIGQNLAIQGALSRLTLAMFAGWLAGDADDARALAAGAEMGFAHPARQGYGGRDRENLQLIMEAFEANGMKIPGHREMEAAIARLRAKLDSNLQDLLPDVEYSLKIFARLATLRDELHHGLLDADLVDDLDFPLQRLMHEGEMGLWTLRALGQRLAGYHGQAALAEAREALDRSMASRFAFSPQAISSLLNDVDALQPTAAGFEDIEELGGPPACRTGKELSFEPFGGTARVTIHGLPGARVEEGRIFWTPPHSGRYRMAAVAVGNDAAPGWNFSLAKFVCTR